MMLLEGVKGWPAPVLGTQVLEPGVEDSAPATAKSARNYLGDAESRLPRPWGLLFLNRE
jgi:hypothetical protein